MNFYYVFVLILSLVLLLSQSLSAQESPSKKWVGTWSTAPQLVEQGNMPPQPGLSNNTLRQIVKVSIGGDSIRLKLSNDFSTSAVTVRSVKIAQSTGAGSINTATSKELRFNGSAQVQMQANSSVYSDPIAFALSPRMELAITIYFGQTSATVTGHPGSRTTSYLFTGDQSQAASANGSVSTDHWYVINTLEVYAPAGTAAMAVIGNSITDGRGSTTNMQNRWPDILSQRLLQNSATSQVGVLNMGIGGNCVLSNCLGPAAVQRYQRDILDQNGVRWVVIFHGINDIGGVKNESAVNTVSNNLIQAYQQMIQSARAKNLKVYGATIMPFKGNTGYDNAYSQRCRDLVNAWIRNSGAYDAVIDFDRVMRNPQDTLRLVESFQNDFLHPTAAGYQTMGNAVDLDLFVDSTLIPVPLAPTRSPRLWNLRQVEGYRLNGQRAKPLTFK